MLSAAPVARLREPYEAVPQTPPAVAGSPVAGTEEEPDVMGERSRQDRTQQRRMEHPGKRVGGRK
ncbi:hypothetical protein San01_40190 [Streptomyces angustmyceticus]|uniref:Uncharacterized protein n=1 Tax=Streptomyces angustmyceticus TaxID=285578 RepID=A0A5J4LHM0_9ACTN|nr:hypothetical protein San01_40190 [Streptomyces angustmyceticus]